MIIATGAYQQPWIPPLAAGLSGEVTQLHSAAYRNPGQIPGDEVLVVGAANSGAQIAADLAATHQVWLSRGTPIPRLPRRILGIPIHSLGDRLGLIPAPLDTWRGRTQRGYLLVGPSLRQLARRHGIHLLSRATHAEGHTVTFADGQELDVSAVVWATGYRPDYSWIRLPVIGPDGLPRHQRGVTQFPGLYFLGMHNQYSRGSALIHWVRHDAAHITGQARAHTAKDEADAASGDNNDQDRTTRPREQVTGQLVTAAAIPGRPWAFCDGADPRRPTLAVGSSAQRGSCRCGRNVGGIRAPAHLNRAVRVGAGRRSSRRR